MAKKGETSTLKLTDESYEKTCTCPVFLTNNNVLSNN